jgi:hypothetical protein
MIPIFFKLHIKNENNKKKINFWFPIILIWVIYYALLILLSPFILLAAIIALPKGYSITILSFYLYLFVIVFYLSDLKVDVESKKEKVFILFQ